jgi:hypothetical protein
MHAAKGVTGRNHVAATDRKPGKCQLADDMEILRDFACKNIDVVPSVVQVGFIFAGFAHDLREVIEYSCGMPHVYTAALDNPMLGCCVVSGSLWQWRAAGIIGCHEDATPAAREAYNKVYQEFRKRGLYEVFDGFKTHDNRDGTFLLLEYKR